MLKKYSTERKYLWPLKQEKIGNISMLLGLYINIHTVPPIIVSNDFQFCNIFGKDMNSVETILQILTFR